MRKKTKNTSSERSYWNSQYDSLSDDFDYFAEDDQITDSDYAEGGEYYTEAEAEGGEYYTEAGAEGGEYYAEAGAEGGEYYTEAGAEGGEYYVEAGAEGGEYYVEAGTEAGEYYAEAEAEGTEYYAEENWDGAEEVDTADNFESHQYYDGETFFDKLFSAIAGIELMDKIIICSGILAVVLVIVFGSIFMTQRTHYNSVDDLAKVGRQIEDIDCIGEKGLIAVADAKLAKMLAAEAEREAQEAENSVGYEENDYNSQVSVQMNLTSVLKDLKIKFNNKSTGKLIANVPFKVEVKYSDGKSEIWTDDDMDGIIYKNKVTTGKCTVKLLAFEDEKYDKYSISTDEQKIEIKSTIAYEKIDVSDEVKSEAEINTAKEDTAKNDTQVESSLTDTVAWVESTSSTNTYTQVAKNTIPDPTTVLVAKNFLRISAVNNPSVSGGDNDNPKPNPNPDDPSVSGGNSGGNGGGTTPNPEPAKVTFKDFKIGEVSQVVVLAGKTADVTLNVTDKTDNVKLVYSIAQQSNTAVATAKVDANGKVTITGVAAGEAVIKVTAEYEKEDDNKSKYTKSVDIRVKVAGAQAISFNKETATAYIGAPLTLTVTVVNAIDTTTPILVASSNEKVATVKAGSYNASSKSYAVEVTGVAEGDVTITVAYQEKNQAAVSATCTVKVKPHPKNDKKTLLKDNNGKQIYVLENEKYREAVYADYYVDQAFYLKGDGKYTGWQTIDGKVYFYKADGTKVTGEQVIQGAKYNFASDGSLVIGNGTMGIDVSKWNGKIDWKAVKNSGVSYVIIRCGYRGSSQGMLVADSQYKTNIAGAIAAGLKVGVYFFTQATNEVEAVEEASYVLDAVKGYKISYPIFLDVESSGGRGDKIDKTTRTAVCKTFCATIKNAGYTSGIYANKTWLNEKIDASALSAYKIWLAQYASTPTYTGRYDMWQYKSTGKVSGISGDVDLNVSYLGY